VRARSRREESDGVDFAALRKRRAVPWRAVREEEKKGSDTRRRSLRVSERARQRERDSESESELRACRSHSSKTCRASSLAGDRQSVVCAWFCLVSLGKQGKPVKSKVVRLLQRAFFLPRSSFSSSPLSTLLLATAPRRVASRRYPPCAFRRAAIRARCCRAPTPGSRRRVPTAAGNIVLR